MAHYCMSWPCPLCQPQPGFYPPTWVSIPSPPYGCICPPTSERTCRSEQCPRRSANFVPGTVKCEGDPPMPSKK